MTKVRCAIYTRKSSEEGLEQDFNSLDAQREACGAYVLSQASEGWSLLPEAYDDGGLSGGTLERPALRRLLQDIEAGRIDIVVVYKVDRLTRSLLDFSRLVEAFDKAGTSFVSVTQSFNTTTSMGRLTLNMLLSFAQFEREVTAERIRDKIAASKARGMWMGGVPPLGYQPDGRTLAIVEDHAALIRHIFRRHLALGNVRLLAEELEAQAIHVPQRVSGTGKAYGGGVFMRGQLYKILSNPIYTGEIHHGGKAYPGKHQAIVDRELWDQVLSLRSANVQGVQAAATARAPSLLSGRIVDEAGEPLVAAHAWKGKLRYRYYVSRALQYGQGSDTGQGIRIPALDLEKVVAQRVAEAFDDPLALAGRCSFAVRPDEIALLTAAAKDIANRLRQHERHCIRALVTKVAVGRTSVCIELALSAIAHRLGIDPAPASAPIITLDIAVSLRRTGRAVRFVQPGGNALADTEAQPHLVRLLGKARVWWNEMLEHGLTISELSRRCGVTPSYASRVVRLAFLAPELVEAILSGNQPAELDAARLLTLGALPLGWAEQKQAFNPL